MVIYLACVYLNTNIMKLASILGVAAAVGVVWFFRTERGKALWNEYKDNFTDLLGEGENLVNDISGKATRFGNEARKAAMEPIEG